MSFRLLLRLAAALTLSACGSSSGGPVFSPNASLGGTTLGGPTLNADELRGHPVVVVFWAAWCTPCRAEQPQLNVAYAHWAPKGVRFVGDDMLDDAGAAKAFTQQQHIPYPSVFDNHASVAASVLISAAPAIAFIDSQGRIVDRVLGGLEVMSDAEFDQELTRLTASH